ncbi:uncharacterized protein LOC110858886 isoform X1 [Folsomia candida]|uniref:uncharacterized protein LOC110858886 isoform X1 n=1 Tax=Folsomia candida TaxID=158441 RepID=UPI001604AD0F|nr:uncharacterized protein LOC110858886 isoform X1 [Folsomia candida]XP_035715070.1 uncharacterized protein LOC110858886 isoform X1 [Folsomia candida]
MANVTAFCLTNLRFDLTEEEFKEEALRVWGRYLQPANFQLFKRDGNQRKGVVSDFQPISFALLQEISRGEELKGRNICIKPDVGEPRDDLGRFKQLATPLARRERDKSHGVNYNKLFLVFHPDLIADMGRIIAFKKILIISPVLTKQILEPLGDFTIFYPTKKLQNGELCIRYQTSLEAIQAMLYISGNTRLGNPPPMISNPFNTTICTTNLGTGMGKDGRILNLLALYRENGGYVPFTSFKQTLLERIGKTHNASVIAIALATLEVGTVVVCAPSNEAADNFAETISTLMMSSNIPLSVLRVESKSKEQAAWQNCCKFNPAKKPYDVLRDLV